MTTQNNSISNSFDSLKDKSDEYKVIRFSCLIYSPDKALRVEGYKNLLLIAQKQKWTYYIDEIVSQLKGDKLVYSLVEKFIPNDYEKNCNKIIGQIETYDKFFSKINSKELKNESVKIKDYAKHYYDLGCFSQYISIFNRFLINLKSEFSDAELHQTLVKFVLACSIKRQYDLAISELSKLKNQYNLYDIGIYTFFLKLINGKFKLAEDEILSVGKNIFPEVFDKLIDKESIFKYFVLMLLVCYRKQALGNLVSKFF